MMKRLFAVLLAMVMLLSVAAVTAENAAEDAAAVPDTLLFTVNGVEVRENNESLQSILQEYSSYLGDPKEGDLLHLLRMIVCQETQFNMVISAKQTELLSADQIAALRQQAWQEWNDMVDNITVQQFGLTAESTDEERTEARTNVLMLLEMYYGYTEDSYVESAVSSAFSNKVVSDLMAADPSLAATEEEIRKAYDELVASEMQAIGNDAAEYEYSQAYEGEVFHYVPEGYRGIIHILLPVDEELMTAWEDLSNRLEESSQPAETTDETGEAPAETPEPVTPEMVEAARQAILDSVQAQVDEIREKLANGSAFEDLIAEYGADPGMMNTEAAVAFQSGTSLADLRAQYGKDLLGDNAKTGYMVHADSIRYYPAFTEAAAALEKVGSVSDPVLTSAGVHILYYLRDVPSGALEMTEADSAEMRQEVEGLRVQEAINQLVNQWFSEAEITYTAEGENWKYDEALVAQLMETYFPEDAAE